MGNPENIDKLRATAKKKMYNIEDMHGFETVDDMKNIHTSKHLVII